MGSGGGGSRRAYLGPTRTTEGNANPSASLAQQHLPADDHDVTLVLDERDSEPGPSGSTPDMKMKLSGSAGTMTVVFNRFSSSGYQLPGGARVIDHDGDTVHFEISMPVDDDGFFGRSGWGIGVKVHMDPYYPRPLPGVSEEALIRVRTCAMCSVRYAVFDEHRFCPTCGPLSAMMVAVDALEAETTRLDLLVNLPPSMAAVVREQGGLTRSFVDTIKNLATIVEVLAGAVFRAAVVNAATTLHGKGTIFQRLEDTADLFVGAGYPDLRVAVGNVTWHRLQEVWAARHVFTHTDGVIDARYLARVPSSPATVGQRLTVSEAQVRQAIADARSLCTAIGSLTAP